MPSWSFQGEGGEKRISLSAIINGYPMKMAAQPGAAGTAE